MRGRTTVDISSATSHDDGERRMTYAEHFAERQDVNTDPFVRRLSGAGQTVEDAHILIVDDNPDVLRLTVHLLERGGFWRINTAAGGREALAAIRGRTPDVLLLDVHMPDVDGVATLRSMSVDGRPRSATSVLAVSGDASPEVRRSMLLHGAEDFVVRPCSGAELVDRVRRLACRTQSLNSALERLSLLDGLIHESDRHRCRRGREN
jgi:CheY-like chemotaxis protein